MIPLNIEKSQIFLCGGTTETGILSGSMLCTVPGSLEWTQEDLNKNLVKNTHTHREHLKGYTSDVYSGVLRWWDNG